MRDLRATADEFGLMLVFDEIQTGVGRTGKMWAHEWSGIAPDIMASAKGLGGGFPVGAVLASEKGASGMEPGYHGTTFGGNPLAMAVANAVLDVISADGFMDSVDETARYLWHKLLAMVEAHPTVFDTVRGAGLMLGIKCAEGVVNGDMITKLMHAGLLTVGAADNIVRFLPPLIVTKQDCDEALAIMDKVATEIAAEQKGA